MRASAKKLTMQGPVEGKWDLPAGWEWKQLGEVCPTNRKKIHPATKPELPYIGMEHIEPHTGVQCGQDIFGHMKSTGVHFFPGDVLYGRLRPYLSKVFLARHEGACSPEFIVLEENNSLSNKYLVYFLRSGDFVNFASHPDNTSGERPRIDYATIAAHPISLPPSIQDQERIVDRIDSLFAELDKAEGTLRYTITLCEQYKQSLLKAAVTGELSKEWRKANNEKWRIGRLKDALLSVLTGPFGSSLHKDDYIYGGIPVINPMHIQCRKITPSDKMTISKKKADSLSRYYMKIGDIVIARRGEMGRCAPVHCAGFFCGTGSMVLRPKANMNNEFLAIAISSDQTVQYLNEKCVGTTMKNLNQGILLETQIPLPCSDEQSYIIKIVNDVILENTHLERQCDRILNMCSALRQSILKQAFTGKLT